MTEIGDKETYLKDPSRLDKSVEISAEVSSRRKNSITNEFLSRIYAGQAADDP